MIDPKLKAAVYNKCNHRCAYCGIEMTSKECTVDHVLPKSKGGKDNYDNLLPSCKTCNHSKGSYTLNRFRRMLSKMFKELGKNPLYRLGRQFGFINEKRPKGGKVEFYYETIDMKKCPEDIVSREKKQEIRFS